MRSKAPIIIAAALAALAVLAVGLVAVAGADDDTDLPPIGAADLLARMTARDAGPQAISGDIVWSNRLFGELPAFGGDSFADATRSPLMSDGAGRLWAQGDRARLDAYAQSGDQVVVVDGVAGTVWVYDGVENTARLYELAGGRPGATVGAGGETKPALGSPATGSPALAPPTPERLAEMLAAAARFMSVEVTGESVVAGRDAYLLAMTPAASDMVLGSVQAAVDGRTFLPLRVDVTARGAEDPTLSFGFERVSYAAVDEEVFAFSPPPGAEVTRETIDLGEWGHGAKTGEAGAGDEPGASDDRGEGAESSRDEVRLEARRALLDLEQAAALVDFELRAAEGYTARAFRWAYVFDDGLPLDAGGSPLFGELMGAMDGEVGATAAAGGGAGAGDDDGSPLEKGDAADAGPAAVLLYGEGFGAVALAQTRSSPELRERLEQSPALFETRSAAGLETRTLLTPLGGAVVWEDDGVTLVAFGMVPGQDLLEFVESVR